MEASLGRGELAPAADSRKLTGRVARGAGETLRRMLGGTLLGALYERTGVVFYPGTLNLELAAPFDWAGALRIESDEMSGGDPGFSLVPCLVFDELQSFLVRQDGVARPPNVVEVLAPLPLRDWYDLADGATVDLTLPQQ